MAGRLEGEGRKVVFEHTIDKVAGAKFMFKNNKDDKLRKLWASKEDIVHAIECIEKAVTVKKAMANLDEVILSSLWQAGVMSYGRCFVKPLVLQPQRVFKSNDELDTHRDIMALRHEYIAHGSEHRHSALEVVVVIKETEAGFHFDWHFPGAVFVGHYMEPSAVLPHLNVLKAALETMIDKELDKLGEQLRWDPEVVRSIIRCEQAKGNPEFAKFVIPEKFND